MKEHFFQEINCEENAYFLGLLIADGNVFKDNTGRQASISITLDLKDEYMLQKFKEVLQADTSIGHDGRGCGQIAVRSNIMAEDLAKYGVVPRKSYHTYLPEISNQYMWHVLRGIFDGDGSISNYLYKNLAFKQKPTVYDYKNKQLSELKIQNIDDIYLFGIYIYKGATIFLDRKYKIFLDFKQHYNLD